MSKLVDFMFLCYVNVRDNKDTIRLHYLSQLQGIEAALLASIGKRHRVWRLSKLLLIRLERYC